MVRELPVLSLANPGMERIVDSSTAEYTSMLLNCREGALAQQLAYKLSLVANTATAMSVVSLSLSLSLSLFLNATCLVETHKENASLHF